MTLFHFINCAVLAYAPFVIAYKYSALNEYSSYWKCAQAAAIYLGTQFIKMMALATFFPATETDEFNLFLELLKNSVDIIDLFGLHLAISYFITGRGEIRFLTAGLGWAGAHSLLSYFLVLFFGARTTGFSWQYVQTAIDSNIDLVFYLSMATLIWLFNRNDLAQVFRRAVELLLGLCIFRTVLFQSFCHYLGLQSWTLIGAKCLSILGLASSTFLAYGGIGSAQPASHQKSS